MNIKEKLTFGVLALFAVSGGGIALGASVNNVNNDQMIYACVTGVNGNITKVSNTQKVCPRGTTPISWNASGPKGEQGAQGTQGPTGPKGDKGLPGVGSSMKLISPDGSQSFPAVYNPYEVNNSLLVKIGNYYWKVEPGSMALKGVQANFYSGGLRLFDTEDCSGVPKLLDYQNSYITTEDAIQLTIEGNSEKSYGIRKSTTNLGEVKSFMVFDSVDDMGDAIPGVSCSTISDIPYYLDQLKVLSNLVKDAPKDDAASNWQYVSNLLLCKADAFTITTQKIGARYVQVRTVVKSYLEPDCLAPIDESNHIVAFVSYITPYYTTLGFSDVSKITNPAIYDTFEVETPPSMEGWTLKFAN